MSFLVETHMLKNYPASNLNRDDTGAPKSCMFAGHERSRISSQCYKHSWRTADMFIREIGEKNLGIRTRKFPQLVCDRLIELGVQSEYVDIIKPIISGFGNKEGKENKKDLNKTAQIMFFSPQDIEAVAECIKDALDECADIKAVKKLKAKELQTAMKDVKVRPITLDIALFGRMVTSNAFRDVEAAMQVAHAISTNKVVQESDYFTAMDDMLSGDTMEESGSGMIGDIDYNSSCYYSYAALDLDVLRENLKYADDVDTLIEKAVPVLIKTMALTNPTGKQNSFAAHALPSAIMIEIKEDKIPVNLVNAFAQPIRPDRNGDLVHNSIQALATEADTVDKDFGLAVKKRLWFCTSKYSADVTLDCEHETCATLQELLEKVEEALK